jgi:hypothetical protein
MFLLKLLILKDKKWYYLSMISNEDVTNKVPKEVREAGIRELGALIDMMIRDPAYCEDPLDLVEAGVMRRDSVVRTLGFGFGNLVDTIINDPTRNKDLK